MKKIITTMTVALILALGTPAFAQDTDTRAEAPAVVETAPAETAPAETAPAETAPAETAPQPEAVVPVEATPAPEAEAPAESATETEPVEDASAFSKVMTQTIELLATLLMALMAALLAKATSYFTKKTKIEIPAKTEEMVSEWGVKAVYYAKEKAHQYNKEKGEKMKGPERLEVALGFGIGLAEEYGMADLAKTKLTKYIEAHLGESRD